jgi:hypothetical protein
MLRIYLKSPAAHGFEVSPVTAFTGAIDVLLQASLVALNRVVAPGTRGAPGREGEAELTERGGLARHGQPAETGARHRELLGRRDDVDLVAAVGDQGIDQASGGSLDASVEREGPTDDGELHELALDLAVGVAAGFAITRSMSGKRSRRAARKL